MLMLNLKRENVKNTVNFGIIYYLIIKYICMKTNIIAQYVKISCKFSKFFVAKSKRTGIRLRKVTYTSPTLLIF